MSDEKALAKKSEEDNTGASDSPLPQELVEQIPPEIRQQVLTFMKVSHPSGQSPIAGKVTESHITKALGIGADNNERQFIFAKRAQWFRLAAYLVAVGIFMFLAVSFKDKPQFLAPMLTGLAGFAAGFGMGKRI